MELKHATVQEFGLLLLLFFVAHCQPSNRVKHGLQVKDPDFEWNRVKALIEETTWAPDLKTWRSSSTNQFSSIEAKKVPRYMVVSASDVRKEDFKPDQKSGPLPDAIKNMLLGVTVAPSTTKGPTRKKLIEVLCHIDRVYVRVRKELFKTKTAYKYLKLGICPVNQGTKDHYYFLYLLKTDCAFKKEGKVNALYVGNVLQYKPPGPILREMAMNVPLQCEYPRYFHTYKVGFYPKLQGGTVFKALQPKSSFTLTPQDASGNPITGTKSFTMGNPMCFEAKLPESAASPGGDRLYITKCYMTASQDPNSTPKYTVIGNQGCMIDAKETAKSKFLTGSSKKVLKFCADAFVFKDKVSSSSSSQQLYMYCEVAMGPLTPTKTLKACNYDSAAKKWKELYGDDAVCSCCDATCASPQARASRNIISTDFWTVDMSKRDKNLEVEPRMKSLDTSMFGMGDQEMAAHADFLNIWDD